MNDSMDPGNTNPPQDQPPMSRWEERQRRREERREARAERRNGAGGWIVGGVLIVVGLVLLAQNFGFSTLANWWALFILIPAVGALANAWRAYNAAGGRLTGSARGSLVGGLILLMVTMIFLFNLNWSLLGPILIILAGAGLLINALLPG